MNPLDQDIAAILDLPAQRLAQPAHDSARRLGWALKTVGASSALIAAIGVGMSHFHARFPPAPASRLAPSISPALLALPRPGVRDAERPTRSARAAAEDQEGPVDSAPNPSPSVPLPPPNAVATLRQIGAVTSQPGIQIKPLRQDAVQAPSQETSTIESLAPQLQIELAEHEVAPEWRSEPSEEDVERVYPPDQLRRGVPGAVVLACVERVDGAVVSCSVLNEQPEDSGFGPAALRLSRLFRFTPLPIDGRPIETRV